MFTVIAVASISLLFFLSSRHSSNSFSCLQIIKRTYLYFEPSDGRVICFIQFFVFFIIIITEQQLHPEALSAYWLAFYSWCRHENRPQQPILNRYVSKSIGMALSYLLWYYQMLCWKANFIVEQVSFIWRVEKQDFRGPSILCYLSPPFLAVLVSAAFCPQSCVCTAYNFFLLLSVCLLVTAWRLLKVSQALHIYIYYINKW